MIINIVATVPHNDFVRMFQAIKLKPRFSDAYNNLASSYMQLGQTQEAMETYQMALVLNPGLVDAHSNLGNLYKATGDFEGPFKCAC